MSRPFWASARKAAARRYDDAAMMTGRNGMIEQSIPQHRAALKEAFAQGYEEASKEWAKLDAAYGVPAVDAVSRELLAAGLRSGDAGTFGLAAQLAGVPACDGCGYRKEFCRCASGVQEVDRG